MVAVHVPDGFIDPPVSLAAGALAAAGVALSLRGTRRELDEKSAPLAGLVAAFVFAAQMINFPVAAGTSGHLLGGALAAILAGPWTGALCVAVVLMVQALFFADGGLTALGVNITDMSLITVVVGWAVFKALVAVLPKTKPSVVAASAVAAFLAVPAASLGFVGFYALGGTSDVPVGTVLAAMTGVHVLIGLGEAAITAATVASVLAVRPDLVRGARHLVRRLEVRTDGTTVEQPRQTVGTRRFVVGALVVALGIAGVVSYWASTAPDGLNKVAADTGVGVTEKPHAVDGSPFAGYGTAWIGDAFASKSVAGVVGVLVTLAVAVGLVRLARRRAQRAEALHRAVADDAGPVRYEYSSRTRDAAQQGARRTAEGYTEQAARGGSATGAHRLYRHADSVVHRLSPQSKLAATVLFVVVVVSTPREAVWAFGVYALLLSAVVALAKLPASLVLKRMVVEVPFVLFAVLMPFLSRGDRVDVLGVSLSVGGLWAAWNVLAKATLGVVCSILLAATTDLRALLVGLERLRMPALLVQIMTFMVRYGDVIGDEMQRMRVARESRGFVGGDIRAMPVVARSAGALFIRSYERGERVHLAMLARGYTGSLPLAGETTTAAQWRTAMALPAGAFLVAVAAWLLH